jgi:nucleotide-binding universal stress UspA family protein
MTAYRRILAAIDLTQDSRAVAERACEIARAGNGELQIAARGGIDADRTDGRFDGAGDPDRRADDGAHTRKQMDSLTRELGLPPDAGSVEPAAPRARFCVMRVSRAAI